MKSESRIKLDASRIKLDELGVQDIDACIVDFNCDPFDPENVQLR